jgi:hypothetical protein
MLRLVFALMILPAATHAEPPITAEAFDALSTGKRMTWSVFGLTYGIEEYLPGRRVRWSRTDDTCQMGKWYPKDGAICFVYDGYPEEHCWTMTGAASPLTAFDADTPSNTAPVDISETEEPLTCLGPDVGV